MVHQFKITGLDLAILGKSPDSCAAQTPCFSYGVSKQAPNQLAFIGNIN